MNVETFHRRPSLTFEVASAESASAAVIAAVAAFDGVSPLELPPLYDSIDSDALDAVFHGPSSSEPRPTVQIDFQYRGHLIRLLASGEGRIFEKA